MTRKKSAVVALSFVLLAGCSRQISLSEMQTGYSLLSEQVKQQIGDVEKSVVGIKANITYEIQTFEYASRDGRLIPDSSSPVGFKLAGKRGGNGIELSKDESALSGGGLILDHPQTSTRYTILTSSHLVSPSDTVDVYFVDEKGHSTGAIFQRRIVKRVKLTVRGPGNWQVKAELLAADPGDDIALITVDTNRRLGVGFEKELAYDMHLTWGDWVFLFGYPREIKQMTGGWVSESPYPGTFAVDAVVRFGFSGGPVFALSRKKKDLVFAGIIKSVPSGSFQYVAPNLSLPPGYTIDEADLGRLVVRKELVVKYGTAYCVSPERIRTFLRANEKLMRGRDILLPPKFYGRAGDDS